MMTRGIMYVSYTDSLLLMRRKYNFKTEGYYNTSISYHTILYNTNTILTLTTTTTTTGTRKSKSTNTTPPPLDINLVKLFRLCTSIPQPPIGSGITGFDWSSSSGSGGRRVYSVMTPYQLTRGK